MSYNLTNVTNANNIYEMLLHMNKASNDLIGILFVVVLSIILYVAMKRRETDTKQVLLVVSAILTLICILLGSINIIGWKVIVYPVILLFASLIMYKFGS